MGGGGEVLDDWYKRPPYLTYMLGSCIVYTSHETIDLLSFICLGFAENQPKYKL